MAGVLVRRFGDKTQTGTKGHVRPNKASKQVPWKTVRVWYPDSLGTVQSPDCKSVPTKLPNFVLFRYADLYLPLEPGRYLAFDCHSLSSPRCAQVLGHIHFMVSHRSYRFFPFSINQLLSQTSTFAYSPIELPRKYFRDYTFQLYNCPLLPFCNLLLCPISEHTVLQNSFSAYLFICWFLLWWPRVS